RSINDNCNRFKLRVVSFKELSEDELVSADIIVVCSNNEYESVRSSFGVLLKRRHVVLVSDSRNSDEVIELFRSGIRDIIRAKDFPRSLFSVCEKIRSEKIYETGQGRHTPFGMLREEKSFYMDNNIRLVPDMVSMLIDSVKPFVSYCMQLEVALYEAIYNAIEHGNLGIDFEMKKKLIENEKYETSLKKRAGELPYSRRKVFVSYKLTKKSVCFRIKDEGDGFDWVSAYEKIKNQELYRGVNGRGMKIMDTAFDEFKYNDKGNEVFLTKTLSMN
ncbi:MAG: ATP-binding protein, partial [bacterium]